MNYIFPALILFFIISLVLLLWYRTAWVAFLFGLSLGLLITAVAILLFFMVLGGGAR